MNEKEKIRRRKYDTTFKRECVQHWLASGKSAEVVAHELGIGAGQLYDWKGIFAPEHTSRSGELEAQVAALLRENRQLREQRDILKKTLGIISEPSPSDTKGLTP